jgi:hypothetical protein
LFVRPRAAEDRVGVRVDPAREEDATLTINSRDVGKPALQLRLRAYGCYPVIADGDRSAFEEAQIVHLGAAARSRGAGAGDYLCRVEE